MIKIIRLDKRHIEQLVQIDNESEHQLSNERNVSKSMKRKEILDRFKQNNELFFGLKEHNEIKGYVTLKPFFPGRKHCEMYWLAVKKRYQGHGIGTKLARFAENYAKKNGFRKLCVYTNKTMLSTRKFYERIGFKFINEFPEFYGYRRNNTAVLYYKKI